jgi:REP element-mobilizing transposase RayT
LSEVARDNNRSLQAGAIATHQIGALAPSHMSHVNLMAHGVWGTKNRYPFLTNELRREVCAHITENAKTKGIHIDTINGHTDHLHALMSLKPDISISTQMQLIKGESTHWINLNKSLKIHFGWASEYFAESVNPHELDRIRAYINNQEEHHRRISFKEEYEDLLKGITCLKG